LDRAYRLRWVALTILLLAYFLSVFHRVTIAMIADRLMVDLSLTPTQIGLLAAVYFYPYSFMQIPAGILSDRIGPKRLVTFMLLLAALASICFSLSESYALLLVSRLLVGLSVSCIFVPTMTFIANFFPASMFSTLASLIAFTSVVGLLAASAPLAVVIEMVGWRTGFLFIGIATAVLSVGTWIFISDPSKVHETADIHTPTTKQFGDTEETPSGLLASIKSVCREWGFWPISIRNHLSYGTNMCFQSIWAGPYLISIVGVDRIEAGTIIMFLSIGGLLAPFSGYLSDRVFKSRRVPLVLSGMALVLFWIPFAFFTDSLTPGIIIVLFTLFGLLNSLSMGPSLAMVKELYPLHISGTAIGANNFFTMSGPAVIPVIISIAMNSHTVDGVMTADTFSVGFLYTLVAAFLAMIAAMLTKETFDASIFKKEKNQTKETICKSPAL